MHQGRESPRPLCLAEMVGESEIGRMGAAARGRPPLSVDGPGAPPLSVDGPGPPPSLWSVGDGETTPPALARSGPGG